MSNAPEPSRESPQESKPVNRRSSLRALGIGLGAVLLVSGLMYHASTSRPVAPPVPAGQWSGNVTRVWRAGGGALGLEICDSEGKNCQMAALSANITAPSQVKTDDRTRASLGFSEGAGLLLDKNTEVRVPSANSRRLQMIRGSAIVEAKGPASSDLQVQVPGATLDVHAAKVAITADSFGTVVDVAHGVLRMIDDKKHESRLHAGEQVRIKEGQLSTEGSNASLGDDMAWSEDRPQSERLDEQSRGLGELKAKKPGASDEHKGAVSLAAHKVQVRIVANLVRTEIDETFVNSTNDVLEGIFRFPLPADAKIERLALDVDGKLEEGAFVERDRAAAIWRGAIVNATPVDQRVTKDDIVWVPGPWRDPALLEWQRGGRFELRIYPIPKRGSRRVLLTYTQVSSLSGDARRYTYPLAYDPSGTTKISQFDLDIQVRGHDTTYGVRSLGYSLRQASDSGVTRLSLSENNFTPQGDIVVEYTLPHREAELKAWAYSDRGASRPATSSVPSSPQKSEENNAYAALTLRPAWPRSDSELPRDLVIIVDDSRSMLGENLKRAQGLALRLLSELEPADHASVMACDTTCEVLKEGMMSAGVELTQAANRFLSSVRAEGASDPSAAIHGALVLAGRGQSERPLSIVYIGDGTPTVGPIRPGTLEKAVERDLQDAWASVVAVGVGSDSDSESLGAIARGGGGVSISYLPGKGLDATAYDVLGAVRGTHLRDVRVALPEGLVDAAPRRPDVLRSGSELWVLARMQRPTVQGDVVLRGRLGNTPFERRWPVNLIASEGDGNAFVPRLFAAARIIDLERLGDDSAKRDVIELSKRFHVASRYTSLLVLESEAMLKAFRLARTSETSEWSGESDDEQQVNLQEAKTEEAASNQGSAASSASGGDAKAKKSDKGSYEGSLGAAQVAEKAPLRSMDMSSASRVAAPRQAKMATAGAAQDELPSSPYAQPPPGAAPLAEPSLTNRVLVTEPEWSQRRWIPMRRTWVRKGSFSSERLAKDANLRALTKAEDDLDREPDHRNFLKALLTLYTRRSELDHADSLVERWIEKEPLDPDALTARADSAARRGLRSDAIRLLGSVVDARPDDVKAQQRLARLYRWSGAYEQSCRFWVALTEFHTDKAPWLVQAVRCSRDTNSAWLADDLLASASENVRREAERLLAQPQEPGDTLSGDLRVEATWSGDADIDVALITPEGQRVSWLGAPTRQVITARDVTSRSGESVAMRNAPIGNYLIELVRVSGSATVHGNLLLTIADLKRTVPFALRDDRAVIGTASITVVPKLVALRN